MAVLANETQEQGADAIWRAHHTHLCMQVDRGFAVLMSIQWFGAILAACWLTPLTWNGIDARLHPHLLAAIFLGGLVTVVPVYLVYTASGQVYTRHAIAFGQMVMGALLIHLTGGRIETHFHIFGSLAFLAMYRDWPVLLTASTVVTVDHILRNYYWPQSIFGVLTAPQWRWMEHAAWVVFEDIFLIWQCVLGQRDMRAEAEQKNQLQETNEAVENQVRIRTAELEKEREQLLAAKRELRESNEELRAAKQEAEANAHAAHAASCAKSDFLATMSHEIRTPMNGILGMADLLCELEMEGEGQEYAQIIQRSADRLLAIINDILDFSKIESGKLEFEHIPFDLRQTIEDCVDVVSEVAAQKNIELICQFTAPLDMTVKGDPGRLRQVILNLLSNALKFTENGEVHLRTDVESLTEEAVLLRISVKDTGNGIPSDKIDHVFERFAQADASTTRQFGGTGLGLAICRQLVELMEGEIGVESTLGQGSDFWFTVALPIVPYRESVVATQTRNLQGKRVLIIDDNTTNRAVLVEQLERHGVIATSIDTPSRAMELLHHEHNLGRPYDLLLCDFHLPDTDGIALGRQVRESTGASPPKMVLLTSSSQRSEALEAEDAGFSASLLKPVKEERLMRCLHRVFYGAEGEVVAAAPALERDESLPVSDVRILLADDNVINQKVATKLLERLHLHPHVVDNGAEALEAAKAKAFDLILMDCEMPEMDGYEATRAIRQLPGYEDCVIVALTANATEGARERCLAAGMTDYISKPLKLDTLRALLERHIGPNGDP